MNPVPFSPNQAAYAVDEPDSGCATPSLWAQGCSSLTWNAVTVELNCSAKLFCLFPCPCTRRILSVRQALYKTICDTISIVSSSACKRKMRVAACQHKSVTWPVGAVAKAQHSKLPRVWFQRGFGTACSCCWWCSICFIFAFLLFVFKHKSQDPLTPHGICLAAPKLWNALPTAASGSVPRCLAALLCSPWLFHFWLWNCVWG